MKNHEKSQHVPTFPNIFDGEPQFPDEPMGGPTIGQSPTEFMGLFGRSIRWNPLFVGCWLRWFLGL